MRDKQEIERSAVRFLATRRQILSFSCLTEPGSQGVWSKSCIKVNKGRASHRQQQFRSVYRHMFSKADKGPTSMTYSASDWMWRLVFQGSVVERTLCVLSSPQLNFLLDWSDPVYSTAFPPPWQTATNQKEKKENLPLLPHTWIQSLPQFFSLAEAA